MKNEINNEIIDAISSNFPSWNIQHDQLAMLAVLQRIHDQFAIEDWQAVFDIFRNNAFNDGHYVNGEYDNTEIWSMVEDKGIYPEQ